MKRFKSTIRQLPALLGVAAGLLLHGAVLASDKKGIGVADLHGAERVQQLKASWYYTWKAPSATLGLAPASCRK
jgi:hypothetical protein